MRTAVVLTLSVLLLGSCVPEFTSPLPQNQGTKIDKELLGTWYGTDKDNPNFGRFDILPDNKPGWIRIDEFQLGPKGNDVNCAHWGKTYTTMINKDKFLSLGFGMDPNLNIAEPNRFLLVNYKVKDDELIVNCFDDGKTEQLIHQGLLKGKIEHQDYTNKVTITSSSEEVAKIIKEKGVDAFLDPNSTFTLTRDKPKIKH
jgi:hypothetical protein